MRISKFGGNLGIIWGIGGGLFKEIAQMILPGIPGWWG
jgi:hypothetical protein